MKHMITLMICLLMMIPTAFCIAEGNEQDETEFDLSNEQQRIAELGIPTVASVEALRTEADALWEKKDYENAASAYSNYAKQANWLAIIISSPLEQYHNSTGVVRTSFIAEGWIFDVEDSVSSYERERNRAILYEGLCHYYLKDYETALPLLIKAVDLISIAMDKNWWDLGMDAIYSIIGYQLTDN